MLYPKIKQVSAITHDMALMLLAASGIHNRLRLLVMQKKFGKKQWSELENFSAKDLLQHPEGRYDGYRIILNQDTNIMFDVVPMYLAMRNFLDNHEGTLAMLELTFDAEGKPYGLAFCKGTDYEHVEPIGEEHATIKQFNFVANFLGMCDINWAIPLGQIDYLVPANKLFAA